MKQENKKETRGRKSIILPTLKKNILLFQNHTDMEITEKLLPQLQPLMKGGVNNDPETLKKQKNSLHMGVYKFRQKEIAEGKKIAFRGRKINGVLRTKWLKSGRHKKVDSAE